MTLDDLLAREAIRDLVARYNSYADAGRFAQLRPLFTDDVEMELGSPDGERVLHVGIDAVMAIFTGTSGAVLDRDPWVVPYIRHFTATHQIDLVDADHATGRCYFAVIAGVRGGAGGLDHWGRYVDDYERHDGRWHIRRRRALTDGHAEGGWFRG